MYKDNSIVVGGFGRGNLSDALPEVRRIDGDVSVNAAWFCTADGRQALYCILDFMDFDQPSIEAMRQAAMKASDVSAEHIHILTTHNHSAGEIPHIKLNKAAEAVEVAVMQAIADAEPLCMSFACIDIDEQLNYRRRIPFEALPNGMMTTIFYGPSPENGFAAAPSLKMQLKALEKNGVSRYAGIPDKDDGKGVRMPPGDPMLAAWRFTGLNGNVKGYFCRFAAHAICCNRSDHYSGDYPAYLRNALEQDGGIALFFNGPCGDIAPGLPDKRSGYEVILGEKLARLASEAMASSKPEPLRIMRDFMRKVSVTVREDFPGGGAFDSNRTGLAKIREESERRNLESNRAFLESKMATLSGNAPGDAAIGLLQLNSVLILALPGESFWTTGESIKTRCNLPDGFTLVTATEHERTLMYIVPPDECDKGGYENTCRLVSRDFEPRLQDAALHLVETALLCN
ncbi:MAG: hypothetical protein IJS15_07030 [Victivallales bacterium]|nr:hypothetical protein [Victivallales bacterium]